MRKIAQSEIVVLCIVSYPKVALKVPISYYDCICLCLKALSKFFLQNDPPVVTGKEKGY